MKKNLNNNYCGKLVNDTCYFTRTYHVKSVVQTTDSDFVDITLGDNTVVKVNSLFGVTASKDYEFVFSTYEKIEDDTFSNVRPLGDWDTYTENYYNFKKMYNIDNLMKSLYEKDNVYLISGNVIWGESYKEYINIIVQYIKEHYNINVNYSVIKEFDNNIKIYKLQKI